MTETPFETRTSWQGETAVIDAIGELDMTSAPELEKAVEAVRGAAGRVVVDLSGIVFLDSSGLSTLVRCRRDLDELGASLRLVAPKGHGPRRVLEISRLTESLGVVSSLVEALR